MLGECIVITELIVSAVAVVELIAERPIGLIVRGGLFEILRDLGWRKIKIRDKIDVILCACVLCSSIVVLV